MPEPSEALSPHAYRMLKRAAKNFARTAQPNRTYYLLDRDVRRVVEIKFTKRWAVGLMWGSFTPESLWINAGPIFTDRDDPAILGLPTWREHTEAMRKYEDMLLNSPGWAESVKQAAVGTFFKSTW